MITKGRISLPLWSAGLIAFAVSIIFGAGVALTVLNATGTTLDKIAARQVKMHDTQIYLRSKQKQINAHLRANDQRIDAMVKRGSKRDKHITTMQVTLDQNNRFLTAIWKKLNGN